MADEIRCGCRGCGVARKEGADDLAQRIRELHKPQVPGLEGTFCQECYGDNDFGVWGHWPCETIKALDGEK
jgi:hypothetical protein